MALRFVFSHTSAPDNTPAALHDLVRALDHVDAEAKQAAITRQPMTFGRSDDALREVRRNIRTRHRADATARSLRGSAGIAPKSFWPNAPHLPRPKARLLLRARCGLSADVATALHGSPPTACHLCASSFAGGHDAAINHVFTCPGTRIHRLECDCTEERPCPLDQPIGRGGCPASLRERPSEPPTLLL